MFPIAMAEETLDRSMLQSASLGLIKLYQRHVSPRKGHICALRARLGGRSCSSYASRAIAGRYLGGCGPRATPPSSLRTSLGRAGGGGCT